MPTAWRFNRGDWSEAYVFLSLLGAGRIYGATAEFERDPATYMDIIEILRYENNRGSDKVLRFRRSNTGEPADISAYSDETSFAVITSDDLSAEAEFLYNAIKAVTNGRRKIEVTRTQEYLEGLRFSSPKAPSFTAEQKERFGSKSDIIITTEDSMDHVQSTDGFSIKSHIGSYSSLLNFADGSNMVFEVIGCNDDYLTRLNAMDSQSGMIAAIKNDPNLSLSFLGSKRLYNRRGEPLGEVFTDNLEYVDTKMIEIVKTAVLIRCGYTDIVAASTDTKDIVSVLEQINPVGVRHPETFYKAKMKDLLFASFGGMTVSTPWDGRRRITGGYIDVGRDGELLYYRALSDDIFNSYLFEHTFFDLPQRGFNYDIANKKAKWKLAGEVEDAAVIQAIRDRIPKKGNCAYIYTTTEYGEQKYCLNLNFQIRFR